MKAVERHKADIEKAHQYKESASYQEYVQYKDLLNYYKNLTVKCCNKVTEKRKEYNEIRKQAKLKFKELAAAMDEEADYKNMLLELI